MPCYHPISCYSDGYTPDGKRIIKFSGKAQKGDPSAFEIPCGKCIGCALDRARQWAIRCVHEASQHEANCFITLTYRDDNLPPRGSITPRDFQLFIKRLRKKTKKKIRYFHCGEYGPKLGRPHYHALIFGYDFPDRTLYREKPFRWYRSAELEELWPFGFSTVADLTEQSASYVARYTMKKVFGEQAKHHYQGKHPEYVTMSRKPGIGYSWFQKYYTDIYPSGVYTNRQGYKQSPPKYYDNLFKIVDPQRFSKILLDRKARADRIKVTDEICGKTFQVSNSDSFRLPVRELVKREQIKSLKRNLGD